MAPFPSHMRGWALRADLIPEPVAGGGYEGGVSLEVVGRRGAETDVLGWEGRVVGAMGGSSSDDLGVSFGLG
jgi:hypothetical protein